MVRQAAVLATHTLALVLCAALVGCQSAPKAGEPAAPVARQDAPKAQQPAAQQAKAPAKGADVKLPDGPPQLPDDLEGPLADEAADLRVRAQRAAVEVDRAVEDSLALYRQKRFEEAAKLLERAREILRWLEVRIPAQAERRARIDDLLVQVKRDGVEYARQRELAQVNEMRRRRRAEEQEAANRLRARTTRLLREANFQMAREDYEAAGELYREVLRLDPTNRDVIALRELASEREYRKRRDFLRRQLVRESLASRQRVDDTSLHQTHPVHYPNDDEWNEIRKRRPAHSSLDFADSAPSELVAIGEKLNRRITVDFSETPLPDVVQFLRETLGVNMVIDPDLLRERSADELSIDLKLVDVEARSALKLMCDLRDLTYRLQNGVVYISARE